MSRVGHFRVEDYKSLGDGHFLVAHTTKSPRFSWSQHRFKVTAGPDVGIYSCECKNWEHTGRIPILVILYIGKTFTDITFYWRKYNCIAELFCVHVIRVFMQLNIEKIPANYILRRYSRNPQKLVPFDRNDLLLTGADGATLSLRTTNLLTEAMWVVHAAALSAIGYDRSMEVLPQLRG